MLFGIASYHKRYVSVGDGLAEQRLAHGKLRVQFTAPAHKNKWQLDLAQGPGWPARPGPALFGLAQLGLGSALAPKVVVSRA